MTVSDHAVSPVSVALVPAANLALALSSAPVVPWSGEPATPAGWRAARLTPVRRLHALLRDQLVFTGLAVAGLPRRPAQHWRAEGRGRPARRGAARLGAGHWPTVRSSRPRSSWRRPALRVRAGLAPGQARQPRRHTTICSTHRGGRDDASRERPISQVSNRRDAELIRTPGYPSSTRCSAGWLGDRRSLNLLPSSHRRRGGLSGLYLWHTRWGYELRALGHSETAAVYAGIAPARTIIVTMCLSGALAGLMSLNEVMGVQHRLMLNMVGGAGYVGIAVSLMGRNHPVGIVLASILFGALYQGGSELSFDMPRLTRDMVVVIQGLIILVCGALEYALRGPIEGLFRRVVRAGE